MKTTFGELTIEFTKGWCPLQEAWVVPLREAWGLAKKQRLSPSLERKLCHTAVETGSFEKAATLATEWGCPISDGAIHACISRVGQRAAAQPLVSPCSDQAEKKDTLIIMMDGWMARHRGKGWGFKKPVEGYDSVNWHEIKSAIIYRLKDQASLSPKRNALLAKHVVASPAQTDPITFGKRVHQEACRMGMAQAHRVYVVMDGAIWLWNIFKDRFSACATGILDFYHASEHLHTLADELFSSKEESAKWLSPLLEDLKNRSSSNVFCTIGELISHPPNHEPKTIEAIGQANTYFQNHKNHMDYATMKKAGLPIGSGSMESQCSQFQNRLKRRGQFWSKPGFAALLEVSIRYQNGEQRSLWAA